MNGGTGMEVQTRSVHGGQTLIEIAQIQRLTEPVYEVSLYLRTLE